MKPTDFSVHVTSFLTHYLAAQRNVSPNTIKAYRDVFTLLLRFCRDVRGIVPERLCLAQIDVSLVEAFLDYLERERKSSSRTRNHRLAALHAFFRYVQAEEPDRMLQCQKILLFHSGNTLAPGSPTFRKKSWLRSWRSRTSEPQLGEEMQFC
ncbi:MAG TPA: site-specific integrase [Pyrinomonadaceae bacterium]|nr:site-specific integrase [Pyrinomonadaceae bacterium]